MDFAAIEIKTGETAQDTIKFLMEAAQAKGCLFATFELLGILTVGKAKYIRFRTEKPLTPVLEELKVARGVVHRDKGGYLLHIPGKDKLGTVSISAMQSVGELGIKKMYRGPAQNLWDRQFLETPHPMAKRVANFIGGLEQGGPGCN